MCEGASSCSLFVLDSPRLRSAAWAWSEGCGRAAACELPHNSGLICYAEGRVFFVECRHPKVLASKSRRIGLPELWQELYLVALDVDSGESVAVVGTTSGRVLCYDIVKPGPPAAHQAVTDQGVVAVLIDRGEGRIFAAADRLYVLNLATGRHQIDLPIDIPGLTRDIRWDHQIRTLSLVTDRGVVIWNAPIYPNTKMASR